MSRGGGGLAPPPMNKLSLLKTVAFELNFEFWPPLITLGPPKLTALGPAQMVGLLSFKCIHAETLL